MFFLALLTFILLLYNYSPNSKNDSGLPYYDDTTNTGKEVKIIVMVFIDGIGKQIMINKFDAIKNEDIPVGDDKSVVGIYYDQEYKHKYQGEAIKNNTTFYAKTEDKIPEPFFPISFALGENENLTNCGYTGIDLITELSQIDNHFNRYPLDGASLVFRADFNPAYFQDKAVIMVYCLAAPDETEFKVNQVRKAGTVLDVNLSFRTGEAQAAQKYYLFVIKVNKVDIVGIEKLTISVINKSTSQKESYYYGDSELKKEAKVTLIIGDDYKVISVPLNHTLSAVDIPENEKYTSIAIYYDEDFNQPYNEPIKKDTILYINCKLNVFSVVFIIADQFKMVFIDKGQTISLKDVPPIGEYTYIGLYYDSHYRISYGNEPILNNSVFYVKYE